MVICNFLNWVLQLSQKENSMCPYKAYIEGFANTITQIMSGYRVLKTACQIKLGIFTKVKSNDKVLFLFGELDMTTMITGSH